jgi:hypothetical protein
MPRPGGAAASRQSGNTRCEEGARTHRLARAAKMFPRGHQTSVGEADTSKRPRSGERSLAAQGERSERPVAGTDAAAQADQPEQGRRPSAPVAIGTSSSGRLLRVTRTQAVSVMHPGDVSDHRDAAAPGEDSDVLVPVRVR